MHAPRLVARSHPLPLTEAEGIVLDVFLEILAALFLLVPLCFLAAAYCINPGTILTILRGRQGSTDACQNARSWITG